MKLIALLGLGAAVQAVSPGERVLNLLKEIETNAKAESEEETKTHEEFQTWADKTLGAKRDTIKELMDKNAELTAQINSNHGSMGSAKAHIEHLTNTIKEEQESLKEATALRKKERKTFQDTMVDLERGVKGLRQAVDALAGAGMKSGLIAVNDIKKVMKVSTTELSTDEELELQSFLNNPAQFYQTGRGSQWQAYQSQSGQIQGILKNMLVAFSSDMQKKSADEMSNQHAYNELKANKEAAIAAATKQLNAQKVDLGENDVNEMSAQEERDQNAKSIEEMKEYVNQLTMQKDQEQRQYDANQKVRNNELKNLATAISTVEGMKETLDASHADSVTSFVQMPSPKALVSMFQTGNMAGLTAYAKGLRGGFKKVVLAMGEHIRTLEKEQKEDDEDRKECMDTDASLDFTKQSLANEKNRADAKKTKLEAEVAELNAQLQVIVGEDGKGGTLKDEQENLAEAKEMRSKQNADFRERVTNDEKSLAMMKDDVIPTVFPNGKPTAFVQISEEAEMKNDQPKGVTKSYEKQAGMINLYEIFQNMVDQIQSEIDAAREAEKEAVASFGQARKKLDNVIADFEKQAKQMKRQMAKKGVAVADLTEQLSDVEGREEALAGDRTSWTANCKWVENNYSNRQDARTNEIKATKRAIEMLKATAKEMYFNEAGRNYDETETSFLAKKIQKH